MQNGTPQTEKGGNLLEARLAALESKLRQVENLLQSKETGNYRVLMSVSMCVFVCLSICLCVCVHDNSKNNW